MGNLGKFSQMLQFVIGRREGENYFSYAAVFTNTKGSCVGQYVLNQPKKADVKQKQTFKVHKLTRAFQGKTIKTGSDGIHLQSQHMRGLDREYKVSLGYGRNIWIQIYISIGFIIWGAPSPGVVQMVGYKCIEITSKIRHLKQNSIKTSRLARPGGTCMPCNTKSTLQYLQACRSWAEAEVERSGVQIQPWIPHVFSQKN